MTALYAMILKEFRQVLRDKRMVGVLLIAPLFQLLLFGHAVELDVREVALVVVDEDHTAASRSYVDGLAAGDSFAWETSLASAAEAEQAVQSGAAQAALIVPRGFASAGARGEPARVQILVDGSDMNRAIFVQNAVMAYTTRRALAQVQGELERAQAARGMQTSSGGLRIEPRIAFNPTLDSKIYFVPGVAATLLLVVTMVVTSMGLAREKESGTLEQVMVTPISPLVIVLGKTLPYALIGLLDLALVLVGGAWIFGVPLRGSLALLFLGGCLYILSNLGIGLFLSSLARNQQQAFMGAFFLVLPATILSGFMTPIENMPEILQTLTHFNPVRHFVTLLRAVLLKGATAADLLPNLVALGGIGVSVFAAATYVMWRKLR